MTAGKTISAEGTALIAAIEDSFGNMPYPGAENIVGGGGLCDLERDEIKTALKGLHWRAVTFDILDHLRSALPLLSPEGYRFYLPAYMTAVILDSRRADVACDSVIDLLSLPCVSDIDEKRAWAESFSKLQPDIRSFSKEKWKRTMGPVEEYYRDGTFKRMFFERVSGFSLAQCRVIRRYLEYMRDAHGAEYPDGEPQRALDRYWGQF